MNPVFKTVSKRATPDGFEAHLTLILGTKTHEVTLVASRFELPPTMHTENGSNFEYTYLLMILDNLEAVNILQEYFVQNNVSPLFTETFVEHNNLEIYKILKVIGASEKTPSL